MSLGMSTNESAWLHFTGLMVELGLCANKAKLPVRSISSQANNKSESASWLISIDFLY